MGNGRNYLLVAGGREPDSLFLRELAKDRVVVCADKGISYCKKANIIPKALLGDGDSCKGDWNWAENNGVYTKKYSCDKDYTDLQLALEYIFNCNDCKTLVVTGIFGGRFDHLYSAISVLFKYITSYDSKIVLVDDQEMIVLLKTCDVKIDFNKIPQAISVLPFSNQVKISLSGCKWNLNQSVIKRENLYTISNSLQHENKTAIITLHEGLIGFYSYYGIL